MLTETPSTDVRSQFMKLKLLCKKHRSSGATLVEVLMASLIGSFVLIAIASLALFSGRSFAALTNYVELDAFSRNALDTMTKEIRQADRLRTYATNRIEFNVTGGLLAYVYDANAKTLTRTKTGEPDRTLLKECDSLRFSIYQRNPIKGSYDKHGVATPGTCKVVQLHWVCSREIMRKKANTESVQSARIVIRKQ